jgi:hypothetical protein
MFLSFFPECSTNADYAQNLGLPHFGAKQPADIYCFSELTVNSVGHYF